LRQSGIGTGILTRAFLLREFLLISDSPTPSYGIRRRCNASRHDGELNLSCHPKSRITRFWEIARLRHSLRATGRSIGSAGRDLTAPLVSPRWSAAHVARQYRDDTLILETNFETADGAATLIDFMPPRGKASDVVRIVSGRRGQVAMRSEIILRFDYGSVVPWVTRREDDSLRAVAGPDMAVLRTPVRLHGQDLKTVGDFTVSAGETVPFVLTYSPSNLPPPAPVDAQAALADTEAFWRDWASRCTDAGEWSTTVRRSLITLKALTYRVTGGMVAAPTTSLPEQIGGARNWDYRFCWLRDATSTLLALMNAGYFEEAQAWREWLLRAVAGQPAQAQIMYGIGGERRLTERELPWLPGYEGSKPVRTGNAAVNQVQLDIYGEVMDALHQGRKGELAANEAGWAVQRALLDHLEAICDQPDEGIWEMRSGRRQFTYSKVMAWVAFDRAIKSAKQFGLEGPVKRWSALRQQIHEEVCRRAFDSTIGTFTQSFGSKILDASLLLMPIVGFLPIHDPRVRSTIAAIERHLTVDGFVRRYDTGRTSDGLTPGEGVFLACSFWLPDCLILLDRREDARRIFERLLALRNDVGLLSEEYNPHTKRLVGNFPQALSHIALVNTAHNFTRPDGPAGQRSDNELPLAASRDTAFATNTTTWSSDCRLIEPISR
jgi:GH15 family glucan-1,4-alpha-glucosidase